MVDKPELSKTDWFLIFMFFLCLITGFFIIIPQPYGWAMFWLVVSCVTYLPLMYLPFYVKRYDTVIVATTKYVKEGLSNDSSDAWHKLNHRFAQRTNLSTWLTFILPLYTVNYLVALFGGFDYAQTIAVYQVLSVLTKALFAATTMDIHLDALRKAQRELAEEERANDARRAFFKYIFHEVNYSYWISDI